MAIETQRDPATGPKGLKRSEFVPLEPDPRLRRPRPLFGNQIRWAKWVMRESRRERASR